MNDVVAVMKAADFAARIGAADAAGRPWLVLVSRRPDSPSPLTAPPAVAMELGPLSEEAAAALLRLGFWILALIFVANMILAIYHSGVEAQLWKGPTACTGSGLAPGDAGDLLKQLETTKVVRCDAVNLRVFRLSLANWNIFISGALAALGARAALGRAR